MFQFQFTGWPQGEGSIPDNPLPLLSFVRRTSEACPRGGGGEAEGSSPIIVHCRYFPTINIVLKGDAVLIMNSIHLTYTVPELVVPASTWFLTPSCANCALLRANCLRWRLCATLALNGAACSTLCNCTLLSMRQLPRQWLQETAKYRRNIFPGMKLFHLPYTQLKA